VSDVGYKPNLLDHPITIPQGASGETGALKMPMAEQDQGLPSAGEAYILNPYAGVKLLTVEQAFDCVAFLMGPIQAAVRHGCNRG
jgi:hypothetical protein